MGELDFLRGRIASRHMPKALASSRKAAQEMTCNTTSYTGPACLDVTVDNDCKDKPQQPGKEKQPDKKKEPNPPSKKQ